MMVNRYHRKSTFLAAALICNTVAAWADTVRAFDCKAMLERDGSLLVAETISINVDSNNCHGIKRYLPLRYVQDSKMYHNRVIFKSVHIDNLSTILRESSDLSHKNLCIGDPNHVLTKGTHKYLLEYRIDGLVQNRQQGDKELYWQVTGHWPIGIKCASATIHFPEINLQSSYRFADDSCERSVVGKATAGVEGGLDSQCYSMSPLAPHNGMTVIYRGDRLPIGSPQKGELAKTAPTGKCNSGGGEFW